jgi:hypothetical protein
VKTLPIILLLIVALNSSAQDSLHPAAAANPQPFEDARWWPIQAMPRTISLLQNRGRGGQDFLAQSVAGLAAKAVNDRHGDELVWVETNNADEKDWLARLQKRQPQLKLRGPVGVWELVDQYAKQGLIKGYILYRSDTSRGGLNEHRTGMDCSVNVATSLAGILDGIIVDENLEGEAKAHGLKMLMDVRDKTQAWCFENYRNQFNRRLVCTQDPRKPHVRDLAIAQKAFTFYGYEEPAASVMKWLEPLSPVLGWNGGDEFKSTKMSSVAGHIQTATDWCMNLPVLMAGSETSRQARVNNFDPRTIDWKDMRSGVSFISTDGDNVQFFEGSFFRGGGKSFWSNPDRGKIPFGWSCCFAHLAQLCPEAIDYAAQTQTANDSLIEWGGGYFYPDLFASARADRWELLAKQARRTGALMKLNNTRLIGFNFSRVDSADARKAYEVIAREMDNLDAILVFQYDPYEGGVGKVFWVKDRNGLEIPVITARYAIWEHANIRPHAGTPAKIARDIRQSAENAPAADAPRFDWVIVHAWSWFKESAGSDESAENIAQNNTAAQGGQRGYSPAFWCAQRIGTSIRTIAPSEMAWRLRMKHNPEQTRALIEQWKP